MTSRHERLSKELDQQQLLHVGVDLSRQNTIVNAECTNVLSRHDH